MIPHRTAADDPAFLALVQRAVERLVAAERPRRVGLVHVDDWFDVEWVGFRGKVLGAAGTWSRPGELTLPPFVPARVLAQRDWLLCGEAYEPASLPPLARAQTSAQNCNRTSALVAPGSLLVWYSGNTAVNRKGAVMMHLPGEDDPRPVYIGLDAQPTWRVTVLKGMSPGEAERLLFERAPAGEARTGR